LIGENLSPYKVEKFDTDMDLECLYNTEAEIVSVRIKYNLLQFWVLLKHRHKFLFLWNSEL
jgi:hypothetical protein